MAGKQLENATQINNDVKVEFNPAIKLVLLINWCTCNFFEDHENFRSVVVKAAKDIMHKVLRNLWVKVKNLFSKALEEKNWARLVVYTPVYDFFEAFSFLEPKNVFQGVAVPSLISKWW